MKETYQVNKDIACIVEDSVTTGGCGDGPFGETRVTFIRNSDDLTVTKLTQAPLNIREEVMSWHERLFKRPQPQEQL